jgi:hypothetical protein
MAASHPHLFQPSLIDESEIHKLVVNHFLLDRTVLQWNPAAGEDIPTPITNEIVVFSSFFQCGFGFPSYDFFHGLLDHYKIELVHLNPNFILQITVFIHLYEAFLWIPPIFPLFRNYFFLKYQSSATNQKFIGAMGHQTRPRASFLDLPMKTSLRGWHGTWFYCENHKPSLLPFVARLPEFQGTWSEELTPLKLPQVAALTNKINHLKEQGLIGVYVDAHWLARWVLPMKKHVHLGWEYSRLQDPTRETSKKITLDFLVKQLEEIFQDKSSWPSHEQVRSYHIGIE